jgi:parvulin-like peptidyl-prolyl isomerase
MFATAPLLVLCLAVPQEPTDVLATYRLNGKEATVTRTDVALEMAFHLRRDDRGRQGCDMLADALLTRAAAKANRVAPTTAEVQAFWDQLKQQLIAAGRNPEEFAAVRNTGEKQWLEDISVQIAQERLVRLELGLADDEKVSGEMLKLWLRETREKGDVETDPDKLPIGTAARVGEQNIALIDLGFLLLRTSEDFERDRFVRQVVYLESIEAMARARSLRITDMDLDRAIEERREQAKADPKRGGVPLEQILKAIGMTVDSLRQLRVFRSQILLDKLAKTEFPDESLLAEIKADREAVMAEVGPRRRIGAIFLRALENPNAIITRDFDQAMEDLVEIRARIAKDGFAATASIETELGDTKRKGGDVGWHRQSSPELPKAVLDAAFAMKMTEVSMPIRAKDGCYVITVLDREPAPQDEELVRRLRIVRAEQLSAGILKDADVKFTNADQGSAEEKK